jgi:L-alanine-DL-glutamate epimerase-like enolase superfamily enzyme
MSSDTATIDGFDLWRLEVPLGRLIGDNNCSYAEMGVVAVRLRTDDGLEGWGYSTSVWKGWFSQPAYYIQPMKSEAEMRAAFSLERPTGLRYLDTAIRTARWDLRAKQRGVPLYVLLGGTPGQNRVRAYGSLLDYPSTEEEACARARAFVARGFRALKVKVGAPDVERDLQRLHAIRAAVGPEIELTADANTIWDCDTAIARLREYDRAGIRLGYMEDPLPYTDMEGFARLSRSVELDIIGHDYINDPRDLRRLLEAGALRRIRNGNDIEFSLAASKLAQEFGVPQIFGNSVLEMNTHAAAALPHVDRIEFSDLGWNQLVREPVRYEAGFAIAPDRPGHGLEPDPDRLEEWSRPQ